MVASQNAVPYEEPETGFEQSEGPEDSLFEEFKEEFGIDAPGSPAEQEKETSLDDVDLSGSDVLEPVPESEEEK